MHNLDPIQQHHIENYGLNSAGGSIGARPLAEQRHKEYMAHLERMKWDDDYRYKWEQMERDLQEAKERNYYY